MQINDPFLQDIPRTLVNENWLIYSLLTLTILYVGIRIVYNRFWRRYRQALLYNQEAQKLIQEKNALLMQAAVTMNVISFFSIGMFVFLFSTRLGIFKALPDSFYGWMISTMAVVLVFGGKYLINRLVGIVGDNQNATSQINHQWLINFKNFGFFLLPITISAAFINAPFDNILFFLGLAVVVIMQILNYIKGFVILFQYRISVFYGILYLCTLEILPVLIVWKVIG